MAITNLKEIDCDFSSLERRLLAMPEITKPENSHTEEASEFFNIPESEVTTGQRRFSKSRTFRKRYGKEKQI